MEPPAKAAAAGSAARGGGSRRRREREGEARERGEAGRRPAPLAGDARTAGGEGGEREVGERGRNVCLKWRKEWEAISFSELGQHYWASPLGQGIYLARWSPNIISLGREFRGNENFGL